VKVKLIPGPRDEEKIAAVLNAKKVSEDDYYVDFVFNLCYSDDIDAWLDALYYAGGYGDAALHSQEEYFNWALVEEEIDYFINRLLGDID